jgi:hypothetical protein
MALSLASPSDLTDIECELKKVAYQHALKQLPERAQYTRLVEAFDALELTACGMTRPTPEQMPPPSYPLPSENAIFVDCVNGDDITGDGSKTKPFFSIQHGLASIRQITAPQRTLVLRKGVCFLVETISLTQPDSGLSIMNYPGEEVWISGGSPLTDLAWTKYNVSSDSNVWQTVLSPQQVEGLDSSTITGLMTLQSHLRLTRARYPNGRIETRDFTTISGSNVLEWLVPAHKLPAAKQVLVNASAEVGYDASTMVDYNTYASGSCETTYDPTCPCGVWSDVKDNEWTSWSYWCSNQSAGGWANMDRGNGYWNGPTLPHGMHYNTTPASDTSRFQRYANATGAYLFAWRAQGWFVNMYEINSHDPTSGVLTWDKGGFQGGRGWQVRVATIASSDTVVCFFKPSLFPQGHCCCCC